jgi:hypothetical protein
MRAKRRGRALLAGTEGTGARRLSHGLPRAFDKCAGNWRNDEPRQWARCRDDCDSGWGSVDHRRCQRNGGGPHADPRRGRADRMHVQFGLRQPGDEGVEI